MALIRVTKEFSFEMAHALLGYEGPCKNIHGHSYHLEVTVIGKPLQDDKASENGMVIDFGIIKNLINNLVIDEFDHALVLHEKTDSELVQQMKNAFPKLITVHFNPTCENILIEFASRIKKNLPDRVKLHHLKIRETATAYAEYYEEDNL